MLNFVFWLLFSIFSPTALAYLVFWADGKDRRRKELRAYDERQDRLKKGLRVAP